MIAILLIPAGEGSGLSTIFWITSFNMIYENFENLMSKTKWIRDSFMAQTDHLKNQKFLVKKKC